MKKVLSLAIAAVMLVSTFGCSSKDSSKNAAPVSTTRTKQTSFKILYPKDVTEVSADQMEVFKVREQQTGIKITWDSPPLANFLERYNIVMASGDLPDSIINVPALDMIKYGPMGAFIPLEDLIKQNAPNFTNCVNRDEAVRSGIAEADGHIYSLPMLNNSVSGNRPWVIRKDWLDKLNLKAPTTPDEWYNVLVAFRDKDPDGNGKADTIPLAGQSDLNKDGSKPYMEFLGAWGIPYGAMESTYIMVNPTNNKIEYMPMDANFKEGFQWIAKLYKEGLIDKEIITDNAASFQAKVAKNSVGAFKAPMGGGLVAFNQSLPSKIPGLEYVAIPPMKGPKGIQIHSGSVVPQVRSMGKAVITKACKDPATLTEWFDYYYSDEGALLMKMGTTPKYYTMVNNVPQYTDFVLKNPNGLSQKQVLGMISPAQSQWPFWSKDMGVPRNQWQAYAEDNCINPFLKETQRYTLPQNLQLSEADSKTVQNTMANLRTYANEGIVKFLTGGYNFDSDWDNYIAGLKKLGADDVVKIYQKTYDELLAKNKK